MCTSKGSLFSKIWSHMLVFHILFHCQVVGPFIDTPSLLFGDYSPIVMVRVFVCGMVHVVSQSDYGPAHFHMRGKGLVSTFTDVCTGCFAVNWAGL